jgi:hypothetical protein
MIKTGFANLAIEAMIFLHCWVVSSEAPCGPAFARQWRQ